RQAQNLLLPVDHCGDLASSFVRRHHALAKLIAPADSSAISNVTSPSCAPEYSSAISNVTSPSCAPEYSSAVTWNRPSTVPKPGITTCQSAILQLKKADRISASEAASLKMPEPLSEAR